MLPSEFGSGESATVDADLCWCPRGGWITGGWACVMARFSLLLSGLVGL